MKILLIGASGQVGRRLLLRLREKHEVVGTGFTRVPEGLEKLNLADADAVEALIGKVRPEVILNPGGVTAVDWCEDHPGEAQAMNVDGPAAAARAAKRLGTHFIHFSTDFVFDGSDGPYFEEDEPAPGSVYSRTKLEGERGVQAAGGDWTILRTAVVYSYEPEGKNFLMQVLRAGETGEPYRAFTDQFNSPTEADNLAEAAQEFAERRIEGLYHVAGDRVVSRFDFAREALHHFGLPDGSVQPVTSKELKLKAPRPTNAGLRIDKASGLLRTRMLGPTQGLQRCLEDRLAL